MRVRHEELHVAVEQRRVDGSAQIGMPRPAVHEERVGAADEQVHERPLEVREQRLPQHVRLRLVGPRLYVRLRAAGPIDPRTRQLPGNDG